MNNRNTAHTPRERRNCGRLAARAARQLFGAVTEKGGDILKRGK